ncbi:MULTISPECIES: co-chaperone HscB [Pseudoalteromonas]|uniref:Co-chaperone protein HscB homolog n=1 Tax=Pseudoalteromonas haloplanktis TaxID=228 RepID=A0ABU1BI95_PSEHA|nr:MULTISPECIES: co-chaperone HscB [Pseudoalteromonas]MCF6145965.1 molecular chaperone HscB [Pseudoalteromonas mariniglutinosa NCIMB 1770]MDQ9094206.1 co-chaperone HscB [Pseudoalteromonas haloplanktis]TMN71079.1 co-chaperone HscB [Pseudoalteromonas sp. S1727]
MRYFELFAIPVDYNIDLATVNKNYLELQRAVHPDRHANASSRDKLLAVQNTAEINDALQTLKHPVKRAEYMLSELGVDIRAEQQTLQDPLFLMQQMELREELEELTASADPDAAIAQFEQQIKQLDSQYSAQLAEQLASDDEQQWQLAADNIRKLKFVYKLRDELERIEDSLFDD